MDWARLHKSEPPCEPFVGNLVGSQTRRTPAIGVFPVAIDPRQPRNVEILVRRYLLLASEPSDVSLVVFFVIELIFPAVEMDRNDPPGKRHLTQAMIANAAGLAQLHQEFWRSISVEKQRLRRPTLELLQQGIRVGMVKLGNPEDPA